MKKWNLKIHFPVRLSVTFKTTATFVLMFGVILVLAVAVLTSAFTSYTMRTQNLDRAASFVEEHLNHPAGRAFDFNSFAEVNHVYIEIKDLDSEAEESYGQWTQRNSGYLEVVRRVSNPKQRLMLRVVDTESLGVAGISLGGYIAILAGLLLFTVAFGAFRTRRMMQPVFDMTRAARSISVSDLGTRIDTVNSNDELRELAETFNGMLDRIQDSVEKQNRFVSDASHELRTPLSVVSGYANLLRRWGTGDRAILNESVEKIIEETDNMQQLVERLLFLARADKNSQHVRMERFNLSELMQDVAEETRMIDGEHTLREEFEPDIFITADVSLIKQALRALMDNSLKYTPEGGTVTLSCRGEGDCAEITVEDTGIGIGEKDLPFIFDRFYKADGARTRGKGSSGLGLSIVRWIVERHSGVIRVESTPGQGTKFILKLPKIQDPPTE